MRLKRKWNRKSPARRIKETRDREWAREIKVRDGFKCVICSSPERPNAHHIVPREILDYRYELDNGLTLCVTHHKFSRIISAHNNPFGFYIWLKDNRPELYIVAAGRNREIMKSEVR